MLVRAAALPAQDGAASAIGNVTIRVDVDSSGGAQISEFVRAGSDTATRNSDFRYLARPCATIGDIVISTASLAAPLRRVSNDPWQRLDDTSSGAAPAADATLRYAVQLSNGGRDIPLVVPLRAVARGTDGRSPGVELRVKLPDAIDRVTFPRMRQEGAPGEWRGEYVAVPSFVSVRFASRRGACNDAVPPSSDGGLSWRFWLLVAILVVWVPTYQWWAGRQPEGVR